MAGSRPIRLTLYGCIAGMFYLGLFPSPLLRLAGEVVGMLWQGRHRFS